MHRVRQLSLHQHFAEPHPRLHRLSVYLRWYEGHHICIQFHWKTRRSHPCWETIPRVSQFCSQCYLMLQTFPARCIAWSAGNGSFFTDNVTIRQYSQRELVQTVVSSNDVITIVIETATSTDMSFGKMCNTQSHLVQTVVSSNDVVTVAVNLDSGRPNGKRSIRHSNRLRFHIAGPSCTHIALRQKFHCNGGWRYQIIWLVTIGPV